MSQLPPRAYRSIFLITYSQVDVNKIQSKHEFSECITGAIERATPAKVVQWVVGEEEHFNGGIHYHMGVKLDRQQRWLAVRDRIFADHHINVNFSDGHQNYYSAYLYATKEDPSPLHSPDHPDLTNAGPPRTDAASRARLETEEIPIEVPKVTRLTKLDVSLMVVEKNITTYLALLALAKVQKDEGKLDLFQFIVTKGVYSYNV